MPNPRSPAASRVKTPSDLEIARRAELRRILELARERYGIEDRHLEPYGHYKAKLSLDYLRALEGQEDGKLILVSGMTPTPAGEGKTTTTVALGDALNRIGKDAIVCLREPSLGPCFGAKGGAAGGGNAQVVPMEEINLHFTGDFHAVALAHNLLAALVDNHVHYGNELDLDPRRPMWNRVVDLNDRALRQVTIGLGGTANGCPRESSFEIVPASEIMAILCLATSLADLKRRLGNVIVGFNRGGRPVHAKQLRAHGALAILLKDALKPNLVQTLGRNLAFVHGGPFANIAHGCNSVIATRAALKLADYVVTEAGFGADLGAEKFIDIKCRASGIRPSLVVLVATVRALKHHGGAKSGRLKQEDPKALRKGLANLDRHIDNVLTHFGLPCLVAINRFSHDTPAELELVKAGVADRGGEAFVVDPWAPAGVGAEAIARRAVEVVRDAPDGFKFVYETGDPLWKKITQVVTRIYGAGEAIANTKTRAKIKEIQEQGYGHVPVCIAKTQFSFSTDPLLRGAPSRHVVPIVDVRLAAGAEFLLVLCEQIMTMPGLPKAGRALDGDLDDAGNIVGLF